MESCSLICHATYTCGLVDVKQKKLGKIDSWSDTCDAGVARRERILMVQTANSCSTGSTFLQGGCSKIPSVRNTPVFV